jgi:hypothetical protein
VLVNKEAAPKRLPAVARGAVAKRGYFKANDKERTKVISLGL